MTMFNKTTQSFRFGDHDVTLETGEIARQATGAVICRMDDTVGSRDGRLQEGSQARSGLLPAYR